MFSKPIPSDFITIKDPDPVTTFQKIVRKYIPQGFSQTRNVSKLFASKGKSVKAIKAIWEWCVFNFVYEEDRQGYEQIRLPNRSWADRNKGVDCEDFTILNAGILHHLGIGYTVRMVDYGQGWQHIYLVTQSGIVLDPVNPLFNNEPAYKAKTDYVFAPKAVLTGIENFSPTTNTIMLTAAQKRLRRVSKAADQLVKQAGTKTVTIEVNKLNRSKAMQMAWGMEKEGDLVASRTMDGLKKRGKKATKKATTKRKTTSKRK